MADSDNSKKKKGGAGIGRRDRLKIRLKELFNFLSYGIWRSDPDSMSNSKNILYNAIKTVILTIRNIRELNIAASARSLTYRTLLSIVPLLAVLFAIARGFGIENIIESGIFNLIMGGLPETEEKHIAPPTSTDTLTVLADEFNTIDIGTISELAVNGDAIFSDDIGFEGRTGQLLNLLFQLIHNSLEEAKGGGIFAGVGILLLLYTVLLLFNEIENNFNQIWQVRKGRNIARKVTDYFAMVLLMPLFFVLVNALNILSYPENSTLKIIYILYPFVPGLLDLIIYIVIIFLFTALYKFVPNAKVKFINALLAGVMAGVAFQVFQMLFLSGQLWITRYNAIYGTFAAIPLMLLWIQVSWFITMIGAEISYAAQNVNKFSFERETHNISRRYKDFFTIIIMSEIVKRFANGNHPLTADQLSEECRVPSRLTNIILDDLLDIAVVTPTPSIDDDRVMAFQPALDINLISVKDLMVKLDKKGSEDFMVDQEGEFNPHWQALMEQRLYLYECNSDVLLKDL